MVEPELCDVEALLLKADVHVVVADPDHQAVVATMLTRALADIFIRE